MDMADRKGSAFRRLLCSAERFSDCAISRASSRAKTPCSRSSASLLRISSADQYLRLAALVLAFGLVAMSRFPRFARTVDQRPAYRPGSIAPDRRSVRRRRGRAGVRLQLRHLGLDEGNDAVETGLGIFRGELGTANREFAERRLEKDVDDAEAAGFLAQQIVDADGLAAALHDLVVHAHVAGRRGLLAEDLELLAGEAVEA